MTLKSKLTLLLTFFGGATFFINVATAQQTTTEQPAAPPAAGSPADADTARLGISKTKPADGLSVELPDGTFMVPYTTTIPGTDVEFTMVPIPGGTYTMGSPEDEEDRNDDEGPQVEVTVEPFWMGRYEVSWAEYKKYMMMDTLFRKLHEQGKRVLTEANSIDGITAPSSLYDPSFTYEAGEEPDQPAATIAQFAAKQYTKWLSLTANDYYRLPYEAEWEYACRAGTKTAFYFGDDPDELEDHGWFLDNSDEERKKCGELKPNPWGLYDMYGNVAEWVLDEYSADGYDPTDAESGKPVTVEQTFRKPTKIDPRVVRGGMMISEASECRSASRLGSEAGWRSTDPNIPKSPWWYTDEPGTGVGFRLLRPLQTATRQEQEAVWSADVERIMYEATNRINDNGRGRFGTVDKDLPKDIQALQDGE